MTDYSDPMNTDPPPFPEFEKVASGISAESQLLPCPFCGGKKPSGYEFRVLYTASRTPADFEQRALARAGENLTKLDRKVREQDAEILRLREQVVSLKGLLAEWLIAYQDAASPAIQDALKRGRAAISSTVPRAEQ
jgi:hypothetical protein